MPLGSFAFSFFVNMRSVKSYALVGGGIIMLSMIGLIVNKINNKKCNLHQNKSYITDRREESGKMFTEEQILELYFKRDEHAVEMTSQMYGAKLTRFADSMVAHEDAVECVNDTYIAAWNKIPPQRPHKFLAWLYKVCRNIVCDRIDWNNAAKETAASIVFWMNLRSVLQTVQQNMREKCQI